MKSLAITLSDKLYQKARRVAIENEISISSLLRGELEKAVGQIEVMDPPRGGNSLASAFAQSNIFPKNGPEN